MGLLAWLTGDDAQLPHWNAQRARQAEIETLRASGVVNEPHFLWSRPAREREQEAARRRDTSWRKRTQARAVPSVSTWRKQGER